MKKDRSLPVPGRLGKLLRKSGVRAVITVTRDEGEAIEDDFVRAREAVESAARIEESVDMLLENLAEFLPGMLGVTPLTSGAVTPTPKPTPAGRDRRLAVTETEAEPSPASARQNRRTP